MIHLLHSRATKKQIDEMLETLGVYIKLAVDIRQGILAGGGALHADCEAVRIPTQIGHPFRSKPATYSVPIRPVIPIQTGHPLTKVSDAG